MKTKAILDDTGVTFTMSRGAWVNTYPIVDLPKWIAFYRKQAELYPDQAAVFGESVNALEILCNQIGPGNGSQ